jgi:hypothetical protein
MPSIARFTSAIAVALVTLSSAAPAFAWPSAKELAERRLRTPVVVEFTNVPLSKTLESLGNQAKVLIMCRSEALHAEGVDHATPIHLNLSTPISLKSALQLLLGQLHLTYVSRTMGASRLSHLRTSRSRSECMTSRDCSPVAAIGRHGRC